MKKQVFLSALCVTTALCSLPSVAWGMKEEDRQDPFLIISNKSPQEEKIKSISRKLTGRSFMISLLGEETRFYENEVPGNGDCGYLALGTNRQDATQLLLENIHLEEIRRLIAPEIYDMLSQLPKKHPVVRLQGYQLNLAQQEILTEHYKKICTNLNDLLKRTEKDGREDKKLWEYCKQNLGTIQQNSKQSQSYEAFKSLREQIQQNEEERMQFCSQQETVKCYIKNFMQIPVNVYPILYGDNNWLNYTTICMSNGKYRTNAINAIAYLLGKNLVIVNEEGTIKHQYQFSDALIGKDNTLFLRHIGNWHFNKLIFLEKSEEVEYLGSLRSRPIVKEEIHENTSKAQRKNKPTLEHHFLEKIENPIRFNFAKNTLESVKNETPSIFSPSLKPFSCSHPSQEHLSFLPSSERRETLRQTILKAMEAGELEKEEMRSLLPPEGFVRMRGEVFGDESYLIPHAVALEVLSRNTNGELIHETKEDKGEVQDEKGNHPVKAKGGIHFKANSSRVPLSPGMEGALFLFQELFAGKGMSPSTLLTLEGVSLIDEETKQSITTTVPLQASLTVTGKSFKGHLQEIIQEKSSFDSIDPTSFSALMLGSLLTNPTDAKPGNFMLSEKHEIVGIDNDMALVYPLNLAQKGNSFCHYIEVKNSLYCLTPLMKTRVNEVDPALCKRILSHHGETFVLRWLAFLRAQNQSYEKLPLSLEEKEKLGLPLKLVPGFGKRLVGEIKKLQAIFRDYPQATHAEVLERAQPLVHAYYQTVLQDHERMKKEIEENGFSIKKDPKKYFEDNKKVFLPYIEELEDFKRAIENPQEELSFYRAYGRIHGVRIRGQKKSPSPLEDLLEMKKRIKHEKKDVPLYRLLRQETTHVDPEEKDRQETIEVAAQQFLSEIGFEHLPLSQQREILVLLGESFSDLTVPQSWKQKEVLLPLLQDAEPEVLKAILSLLKIWGLDLNTTLTETQESPLHKLILSETNPEQLKKKVEIYLSQGIDLEVMDAQNNTPLDLACQKNNANLVIQLIKGGAGLTFQRRALVDFYQSLHKKGEPPQNLLEALEFLEQRNPKAKWTLTYERILPSASKEESNVKSVLYRTRFLSKELASQLWDENNKLIKVNKYGRKEVGRIQIDKNHSLYFKRLPELAGLGYAASRFLLSLCGHGAPFMDIIHIGEEFFLVSQGIEGDTLQDVLTKSPEKLKHLDPKRTAEFILMNLLLFPEDGKPDNYIVQPLGNGQYQLVGVDDEYAFASPMVKVIQDNQERIYPHVKSVIFCLDHMKEPLPQDVREKFLRLNSAFFLRKWLRHVAGVHSDFCQMFKPQEAINFLLKEKVVVGIFFIEKMVSRLYERLNRLQHILGEKREHLPPLTPLEILQRLDSDLGKRYIFDEKQSVKDRFYKIEGQFYQQGKGGIYLTSTSAATYLKSHDIPFHTNTIEALKSGSMGPAQAELELESMIKEQGELDLQESGLDKFKTLKTNKAKYHFLKKLNAQKIPLHTQRAFLESLRETSCTQLFFTQWQTLETNHFIQLPFFPHLISLEAPGCTGIKEDIFEVLAQQCPLLEHLNFSQNTQLKHILGHEKVVQQILTPGFISWFDKVESKVEWKDISFFFRYLKCLQLNECSNLEKIKLEAPNLRVFEANGSIKLTSLELTAPFLRRVEFKKFSHLIDEKLVKWVSQWPRLKNLSLEGCGKVPHRELWEIIPTFMAGKLPWKKFSEKFEKGLLRLFGEGEKLKELSLESSSIGDEEVKALAQNTTLTSLGLAYNEIYSKGAKALGQNTTITMLNLTHNNIGDEGAKALAQSTTLTSLNLQENNIGAEGATALSQNTTLTELGLRDNNIGEEGAKAFKDNTTLTSLNLVSNCLGSEEVMVLAQNTTITSLDLTSNGIGPFGALALACNRTITSLDLSNNHLGSKGAMVLAQNTTLAKLNLSSNKIDDEGVKAFRDNKILKKLTLSWNNVGDEGVKALSQNTILTKLNLSQNNIGPFGALALACNRTVTSLDLWKNKIGDKGAMVLAQNTILTSLNLWYNNIGDEGAIALAKSSTLMSLGLRDNNVGDEGAKALSQNTTLTSLDLGSNNITDKGARYFLQNTTLIKLDFGCSNWGLNWGVLIENHHKRNKELYALSQKESLKEVDYNISSSLLSLNFCEEELAGNLRSSQKFSTRVGFSFGSGISPWQTVCLLSHVSSSLNQPVYRLADVIFSTGESVVPVLACVASEEGQVPYWEPYKIVSLFGSSPTNTSPLITQPFEHLLLSDCLTNVCLPYLHLEPKPQKKSLLKSFMAQKDIALDFILKDIVSLYESKGPVSIKPAPLSQLTHPFLKSQFEKQYIFQGDFRADVSFYAFNELKKQTEPSSIHLLSIESAKNGEIAEELDHHQYLSLSPEKIGTEEKIKYVLEEGNVAFFRTLGELASQKHPLDF